MVSAKKYEEFDVLVAKVQADIDAEPPASDSPAAAGSAVSHTDGSVSDSTSSAEQQSSSASAPDVKTSSSSNSRYSSLLAMMHTVS